MSCLVRSVHGKSSARSLTRFIPSSSSYQHKTSTPPPCTDEPFLVLPRPVHVLSSPATSAHLGHQAKLGFVSASCLRCNFIRLIPFHPFEKLDLHRPAQLFCLGPGQRSCQKSTELGRSSTQLTQATQSFGYISELYKRRLVMSGREDVVTYNGRVLRSSDSALSIRACNTLFSTIERPKPSHFQEN